MTMEISSSYMESMAAAVVVVGWLWRVRLWICSWVFSEMREERRPERMGEGGSASVYSESLACDSGGEEKAEEDGRALNLVPPRIGVVASDSQA